MDEATFRLAFALHGEPTLRTAALGAPPTMLIRYGYELEFFCPAPVMMVCLLDTHEDLRQQVRWQGPFTATPAIDAEIYVDRHGNSVRRFLAPAGVLRISRDQIFECDGAADPVVADAGQVPLHALPAEHLIYLLGSRYCETDKLSNIAWNLFGAVPEGWRRVQAICDFVHNHLTFGYQYARADRTAFEAYEERLGVCRDFAHLAATLCRCMNIPTRYANGFLGDIGIPPDPAPMDYNAWIECYLEGGWYIFDARHNMPRIGRITVSRGRDATDIPLATSFGPHTLNLFKVWTDEIGTDVLDTMVKAAA